MRGGSAHAQACYSEPDSVMTIMHPQEDFRSGIKKKAEVTSSVSDAGGYESWHA